jgi:hypothetical protein
MNRTRQKIVRKTTRVKGLLGVSILPVAIGEPITSEVTTIDLG